MKNFGPSKRGVAAMRAVVAFLAAGAWAAAVQVPKEPVKWSLKVNLPEKPLSPGDAFSVQLTATMEDGWHLYSLTQPEGGPIPTRISLPKGQSFEQAGAVESPEPKTEMDPNFNMQTEYYEGEAVFVVPVRVSKGAAAGRGELKVNASFQTCSSELCLPPKTMGLTAEISIAAGR
jgi:thiol:disulfide interchange protein DsbD